MWLDVIMRLSGPFHPHLRRREAIDETKLSSGIDEAGDCAVW